MEERARRLRLVPDEYDQVLRLDRFRQDHPAIVVGAGNGWWQAVIPAPDGEIVTTRYTLRALLDKLDELINANPGHELDVRPVAAKSGCGRLEEDLVEMSLQDSRPGRSARRSGRSMGFPPWA